MLRRLVHTLLGKARDNFSSAPHSGGTIDGIRGVLAQRGVVAVAVGLFCWDQRLGRSG
jgi:hypothetical protein